MSFFDVFLERFVAAHGDRYDYSSARYDGALHKIEIICREHGPFWQEPSNHAKGTGCPECAKLARKISRKNNNPTLSDDERAARRLATLARYAAKPETRAKNAERRAALRESGKSQEYGQKWYSNNRELTKARAKAWGINNKEKRREISRSYRMSEWSIEHVSARIARATPAWADMAAINAIYDECVRISKETGVKHHVDHIEPLRGADRCGLHVEANLRIIPATENLVKGNGGIAPRRKEFLESMTEQEKKDYLTILFNECRASGFPYYEVPSSTAVAKSVITAKNYLEQQTIDSELVATTHGNVIATAFFPHLFSVKMGNKCSPEDVFFSDEKLMTALDRAIHRHDHISDSVIRTAVSLYGGARAVSNFPPMSAAKLYRRYAGDHATVYDPCGGWGGRMLGAAIAENVNRYICTEVSDLSVIGLTQLSQNLGSFVNCEINHCPAELFIADDCIDMVFTSPPYFDHEKYSNDSDQSYLKYNDSPAWINGFLLPVINNAKKMLKRNGVLALNVADVPTLPILTSQTVSLAMGAGFIHEETIPLYIRSINGKHKSKFEPVFIFRNTNI